MKPLMKPGKQRGVAAVEFALVLPILLIAVFGITELGRALYQYNALVKATRDAVRYLAQQDMANLTVPERNAVYAKTKALAVCGKPACGGETPLHPDLTEVKVTLCDYLSSATHWNNVDTGRGTVDLVTVMIGDSCDRDVSVPRPADDPKIVHFRSLVQPATPEPFGWGIPDIPFAAIKTTMASRYF